MNLTFAPPSRLHVRALAVLVLTAGWGLTTPVWAVDITGDITGSYQIGTPSEATTTTIVPATGNGVTFGADVNLASTSTTLLVGNTRNVVVGGFNANGGTLGFRLAPLATASSPLTYSVGNHDVKNGPGSGRLTVGGLVLSGGESIRLTFDGSLKDGASYSLIASGAAVTGTGSAYSATENSSGQVTDNSFVINSGIAVNGTNLVLTTQRAASEYISKSNTVGHFSNPAALTLGSIAAQGRQLGDLVTALNLLDIDGNGFGNNAGNLAVQVKRLAPVANNAYALSAFAASDRVTSQVDDRLSNLRGDIPGSRQAKGVTSWANVYGSTARQSGVDDYDGYRTRHTGLVAGFDHFGEQGWVGATIGLGSSDIDQSGFRAGDTASMSHQQVSLLGAREFGAAFIDGILSAGRHELDASRATAVGRTAVTRVTYYSTDMKSTVGYRFKLKDGKSVITPTLALQSSTLKQPEYTESEAGDLGLAYDGKTLRRLRTTLGVRFNTEGRLARKPAFTTFHLAFARDHQLRNMDLHTRYTGMTESAYTGFTTSAAQIQRNLVEVGVGTTLALSKQSSLQVRYDLQHRQGYISHGAQLKGLWKL